MARGENIETVFIAKNGLEMIIETCDEEFGLGFYEDENTTFESMDKELEEIGMAEFLRVIYYNHPRSCEIGNYEDDFLNWKNK